MLRVRNSEIDDLNQVLAKLNTCIRRGWYRVALKLFKAYSSVFSYDNLNTWYEPLMKYLKRENLLQYFNIPSS